MTIEKMKKNEQKIRAGYFARQRKIGIKLSILGVISLYFGAFPGALIILLGIVLIVSKEAYIYPKGEDEELLIGLASGDRVDI